MYDFLAGAGCPVVFGLVIGIALIVEGFLPQTERPRFPVPPRWTQLDSRFPVQARESKPAWRRPIWQGIVLPSPSVSLTCNHFGFYRNRCNQEQSELKRSTRTERTRRT
jgi:hypothetical protein